MSRKTSKRVDAGFYSSEKSQAILTIIIILVVILALLIGGYFFYINLPGDPQSLTQITGGGDFDIITLSSEVPQFYNNMKFNHNQITYYIDPACDDEKRNRMKEAISILSDEVGIISFIESNILDVDIEISCTREEKHSVEEEFFVAGEGGAREIIQTKRYNIITDGIILLYSNPERSRKCDWPNIELHELLHVFGFDHSKDEKSIMYPYLENCEQKLDSSIIGDLKELYIQDNLADLYFEKVNAVKKGRYLNFNVTVKNSGVISAKGVTLSVLDEGKEVNEFSLKDLDFGAGVTFQVSNFKLNNRNSEDIKLALDYSNSIKEIEEANNIAPLNFE